MVTSLSSPPRLNYSIGASMKAIRRREFLRTAAASGAALMLNAKSSALNFIPHSAFRNPQSADSRVEILLNEQIGQISPDIYGHFVEHLGGVVYDGIWEIGRAHV